jgi:hypothetical protein
MALSVPSCVALALAANPAVAGRQTIIAFEPPERLRNLLDQIEEFEPRRQTRRDNPTSLQEWKEELGRVEQRISEYKKQYN